MPEGAPVATAGRKPSEPFFDDGAVTLHHGDCLEVVDAIPRQSVDLVLTDPPFFMPAQQYAGRAGWQRSWADTSIMQRWWRDVVDAFAPRIKPPGHFVTFCDDESYAVFFPVLYGRFTTLNSLVWDKDALGMGSTWRHAHELLIAARWSESTWNGGGSLRDVLRQKSVASANRLHPVDKPVALLARIITACTNPGDVVLDPFAGSGSTLEAARMTGRRAIGIELDEGYCEVIAKRLSQGDLFAGSETRHGSAPEGRPVECLAVRTQDSAAERGVA